MPVEAAMDWSAQYARYERALGHLRGIAFQRAVVTRHGLALELTEGVRIILPDFRCGGYTEARLAANLLSMLGFGSAEMLLAYLEHSDKVTACPASGNTPGRVSAVASTPALSRE